MEEMSNSLISDSNEEDRISNLPEHIIDHILHFLDMKYVVRTSLLSRRWRNVWSSVSTLYFDTREYMTSETDEEVLPFVRFLERVLMRRDSANIEEFSLYWNNESNEIGTYLDTWIIYALKHNVESLSILIEYNDNLTFRLPPCLFNSSSLTELVLNFDGSMLVLPDSMGLPHLQQLTLANFEVDEVKSFNKLLSSCCPALQYLHIENIEADTDGGVCVIEFSQLKYLKIASNFTTACPMAKIFKLSTPNLESFVCEDYMAQEYSLGILSSLVTASMEMKTKETKAEANAEKGATEEEALFPERMMKFLIAFHNVEELTLLTDVFQVLSEAPNLIESPLQFHNLRRLKLEMRFTNRCFHTLTYLMKISPSVESIFLTSKESNVAEDGELGLLQCRFSHLKYIEVREMEGCVNELKFLELVLKEAVALEKMDLFFRNPRGSSRSSSNRLKLINKFRQKLKALPRISSSLRIFVC